MPLNKQYVEQLSKQLDLQFALTLKLMDKNPLIANFDRAALDRLVEASPEVREQTKNAFTEAVNKAVEEAKRIAREQRPITVTIDGLALSNSKSMEDKQV